MVISYTGSGEVLDIVRRLGRTEDVKFSPSYRQFAVAGFSENKVVLFDISITSTSSGKKLELLRANEIFSPSFNLPHGLDFIDDRSLIVANRNGMACILRLPDLADGVSYHEIVPSATIADQDLIHSPGSVSVTSLPRTSTRS